MLNGNIFTTNVEDALSEDKVELFDENLKLLNSTTTDSKGFY
jgi:hypothetical protein